MPILHNVSRIIYAGRLSKLVWNWEFKLGHNNRSTAKATIASCTILFFFFLIIITLLQKSQILIKAVLFINCFWLKIINIKYLKRYHILGFQYSPESSVVIYLICTQKKLLYLCTNINAICYHALLTDILPPIKKFTSTTQGIKVISISLNVTANLIWCLYKWTKNLEWSSKQYSKS